MRCVAALHLCLCNGPFLLVGLGNFDEEEVRWHRDNRPWLCSHGPAGVWRLPVKSHQPTGAEVPPLRAAVLPLQLHVFSITLYLLEEIVQRPGHDWGIGMELCILRNNHDCCQPHHSCNWHPEFHLRRLQWWVLVPAVPELVGRFIQRHLFKLPCLRSHSLGKPAYSYFVGVTVCDGAATCHRYVAGHPYLLPFQSTWCPDASRLECPGWYIRGSWAHDHEQQPHLPR